MPGIFSAEPHDASSFVDRIIEITVPNQPVCVENRKELRTNRTLPLVMTPIEPSGSPELDSSRMALSQDISNSGLAVIALENLPKGFYYVSLWPKSELTNPTHFRCRVVNSRQIAHGFWSLGLSVHEVLCCEHGEIVEQIDPIVRHAFRPSA